jgi:hypothetical protein
VFYRALLTPGIYRAVKPLAGMSLGKITEKALDYLVLYHYLEGLRQPELR